MQNETTATTTEVMRALAGSEKGGRGAFRGRRGRGLVGVGRMQLTIQHLLSPSSPLLLASPLLAKQHQTQREVANAKAILRLAQNSARCAFLFYVYVCAVLRSFCCSFPALTFIRATIVSAHPYLTLTHMHMYA
jgi:hypothetical protein